MNGIIILDGPDATGKTTLQECLCNEPNSVPIHLTWNKEIAPRMFDYQTEEMLKAVELSQDHLVVVDRHWISEKIYGQVFRGGSPWPVMGRMMDRVWQKHAALYIITLPVQNESGFEAAILRHRKNIDEAHPYGDEQFKELLKQYSKFYDDNFTRADFMNYIIEFDGRNLLSFKDHAFSRLQYLRDSQYQPALNPANQNILGHAAKSRVLMIGEQVNRKDNAFAWPFYEYRCSSLFISEVIDELNLNEYKMMWVNVFNEDGSYNNLIDEIIIKHGLRPIAMGDTVVKALAKHGFKRIQKIMHPSHAMQFNKREEFKKEILEAYNGKSYS
jgi:hypothetical protein